jgi:hypothetical protein
MIWKPSRIKARVGFWFGQRCPCRTEGPPGFVSGAAGAPMLAVVHGEEFVLSRGMLAGRAAIDTGIGTAVLGGLAQPSAAPNAGGGGTTHVTNHGVVLDTGSVITDQDLV